MKRVMVWALIALAVGCGLEEDYTEHPEPELSAQEQNELNCEWKDPEGCFNIAGTLVSNPCSMEVPNKIHREWCFGPIDFGPPGEREHPTVPASGINLDGKTMEEAFSWDSFDCVLWNGSYGGEFLGIAYPVVSEEYRVVYGGGLVGEVKASTYAKGCGVKWNMVGVRKYD